MVVCLSDTRNVMQLIYRCVFFINSWIYYAILLISMMSYTTLIEIFTKSEYKLLTIIHHSSRIATLNKQRTSLRHITLSEDHALHPLTSAGSSASLCQWAWNKWIWRNKSKWIKVMSLSKRRLTTIILSSYRTLGCYYSCSLHYL